MAQFAVIATGLVVNVIEADQAFIDQWYPGSVDLTGIVPTPGVGWAYDGSVFTPPAPAPVVHQTVFSTQEFRARYTLDELIAIDNLQATPALSEADAAKMTTINTSVLAADRIDLMNPNVIGAVNFEATVGLITPARAAEILDPASAPPVKAWRLA